MLPLLRRIIRLGRPPAPASIRIHWDRRGADAWLPRQLPTELVTPPAGPRVAEIERLATAANDLGPQPLWDGYPPQALGPTRRANDVRTPPRFGSLYTSLVERRRPDVVVEFGAAFGVSGMYWLAGLEANGAGELLSFEPNGVWADIARKNLARVGSRFRLTTGTFEENIDSVLGARRIDMAFIDAIHTPEFVVPQLELVVARSAPGAVVFVDDINFSDEMQACWEKIAREERFAAAARIGKRVGVVELAR
jgi:predicted O-methyltransferase YrrM